MRYDVRRRRVHSIHYRVGNNKTRSIERHSVENDSNNNVVSFGMSQSRVSVTSRARERVVSLSRKGRDVWRHARGAGRRASCGRCRRTAAARAAAAWGAARPTGTATTTAATETTTTRRHSPTLTPSRCCAATPAYGGGAYYVYDDAFGRASPPRLFLRGTLSSLSAWSRSHCRCRACTHRPDESEEFRSCHDGTRRAGTGTASRGEGGTGGACAAWRGETRASAEELALAQHMSLLLLAAGA